MTLVGLKALSKEGGICKQSGGHEDAESKEAYRSSSLCLSSETQYMACNGTCIITSDSCSSMGGAAKKTMFSGLQFFSESLGKRERSKENGSLV